MITKKQVINDIKSKYRVDIQDQRIDDGFINSQITISDTYKQGGYSFLIGFGYKEEVVVLDLVGQPLAFERLNIAEGYTSQHILHIAETILMADLVVEKQLLTGRIALCASFKNGSKICTAKSRVHNFQAPLPYVRVSPMAKSPGA